MRDLIKLDEQWSFQIDPTQVGEREEWYKEAFKQAMDVDIPHIWQNEGEELLNYHGTAWYQKELTKDEIPNGNQLYICFGAVDYFCSVWWNGHFIGDHEGGFTPFEFQLNKSLVRDVNLLTVKVYDPQDNAEIPIGKQGSWYTRVSGIWQSVYLEARSTPFIAKTFVTPNIKEMELKIRVTITGELSELTCVNYTIQSHSCGEQVWNDKNKYTGSLIVNSNNLKALTPQSDGHKEYMLEDTIHVSDMKLWNPNEPFLYELLVSIEHECQNDTYKTYFGFRNVSYENGRVYLNGSPLYIRGALDQAFYPDTVYIAPSEEYIKREIRLAKQMGFNLLRKHIKVEIPEYLYWADRLGILIWAEPPNYTKWTTTAQKRFTKELVKMIERDFNHPSIIIWSIYNEEWGLEWDLEYDKEKQAHVREMYDLVKGLDSTRLICDNSGWTHVKTDINDYHRYFVCPDQVEEWKQDLDEYIIGTPYKNFVEGHPSGDQPLIVSEFGVWGLPNINKLKEFYNGNEPWWFVNQGEETHQDDYKRPINAIENIDKFNIKKALGNFNGLASRSQLRMFRAVKSLIQEMRKRPAIAGYVVTELTDIEWETNGWLDFLRQPKEGFKHLVDFNGAHCVIADIPNHNLRSGEVVEWDLTLTNDDLTIQSVEVAWYLHIEGEINVINISGKIPISLGGKNFVCLAKAISLEVPIVQGSKFAKLVLEIWENGEKVASNYEELTITSISCPSDMKDREVRVNPYSMSNEFCRSLQNNGMTITGTLNDNAVVITDNLDTSALEFVRNGGQAIFLAEKGDQLKAKGQYTFRELHRGESWPRASSMNYVDTDWFKDIPLNPEMGWEVAELIPDFVLPFSDYKKTGTKRTVHMFGNPGLAKEGVVISGYFQGWLGQNGGSIVLHPYGKGKVCIVTWKILEKYDKDPIATLVLNKLIEKML